MNKETRKFALKKYILWELILPLALCCMFTVIFSILELNYVYLPYSLDFTIQLSYKLVYYFYSASVFFICGIVGYAILSGTNKDKLWGVIIGTLNIAAIPFILYLIKHAILSSTLNYSSMQSLFDSDLMALLEDGIKYVIFLVPIIFLSIYYRKKNIVYTLNRPYFSPIGSFQLVCIIFFSAWFVASLFIFISQESSQRDVWGLVEELLRSVFGYFLAISGFILFCHKKKENV
ncbi:MAG: hypothetical protein K6F14_05855 [Clostridiales bacterium]|nr:hypothetical protein [Clostridiales bacterium]